jgi:hypothetical protein
MYTALQITSLVLSLTALIVTILGAYASIVFYNKTRDLNSQAQDALSRIDEKTELIQSQLGRRFDATLSALIGDYPAEDEDLRRNLIEQADTDSDIESRSALSGDEKNEEQILADYVVNYFNLRGLRYTTITDQITESIYNLGANNGFSLFDGDEKISLFGYFHEVDEDDIIMRVRGLLSNISISYTKTNKHPNPDERNKVLEILNQISIEVLIPEEASRERLDRKFSDFKDEFREVPIDMITPSELREEVERKKQEIVS